eukprot:CAMPEP_0184489740 /NCGR_PEP_ID=MMETSP0113_2-20130426/16248_1 /TAXON_ID=91329 /ORGANISM="Norrisiella sphaerica, Strain BC52" /LENGTH=251 /DNA_ID=CAMNT_0026873333 /DNA_START=181 /DNA_END=936 /DNA_ORIENTATION=+
MTPLSQGGFQIDDASTWTAGQMAAFVLVIFLGLEILRYGVPLCFNWAPKIPVRGKHLDEFEFLDNVFIWFNKCAIGVFTYHLVKFCWSASGVEWRLSQLGFVNGLVALALLHIVYDFFYTLFHRLLHNRNFYRYIHKHHHRQRAPSRGNLDAINVHPFEFVVGEYFHLVAAYLVSTFMIRVHILSLAWFVVVGGILASLNHTRLDLNFLGIYSVKVHDVHHRLPESNYGQYIMLWDKLMGSYKPYNEEKDM